MQLDSRIAAVVTGGASGLGAATARRLAGHGVKVALFDLNAAQGEALAAEIGGVFCQVDVTSETQVDAAFERARAAHGQERVLVNCAGTGNAVKTASRDKATGEIKHFPLANFDRIIQINLVGTFRCIAKSAAGMLTLDMLEDGERGAIVNTASVAGLGAAPKMSIYAASKHAVIGLTKSAAIEYAKKKIRVNAVCPAVIDTDMFRRAYEADPRKADFAAAMHPVGRIGKVEEIASAVMYLCSDGAAFTTGHCLTVDGGATAI